MPTYLSPGIYTRETDFSFYVKQISTSTAAMIGIAQRGPMGKATLVTSWEQFVNKFGSYIQESYLAYAARAFFDNGGKVLWVTRTAHYLDPTDRTSLTAVKSVRVITDRRGHASLGTGDLAHNDRILWTSREHGSDGDDITITLDATGASTPLSVAVAGTDITVHLATNADSEPISTVSEVVTALTRSLDAMLLIQPPIAVADDDGVVQPVPQTHLSGGGTATDTLQVNAIHEGTWGDTLSVKIENGTQNPATEFNLVVYLKGQIKEVWKDLSMDEAAPNHVEQVINDRSDYITAEDLLVGGLADDRPENGSFDLSGGDDGLVGIGDADYTGDPSQHTGFYSFDEIDALNLIMVPGVTTATVINAGITYAEGRKDLLYLCETPYDLEPQEAVDFRRGQGIYTHGAFNSSYAALYYPWLEISDPMTGKKKLVPPSGAIAGAIARSDAKTYVWYAPAGIDRGRLFNILSVGYKTSEGERDVLYPEQVNAIASFPDTGINIWGQRTLQSQPSALDRINVRRLMMYMEEAIAESSKFVVFEPNNAQTWRALLRLINPFMQDIKDKGGVYDFATQCDEETNTPVVIDRNEMVCRIFVKPTKAAEFVELNFILTTTGADFKEIFGS